MGGRLSRSPAVEAFYESYHLNQYLDLYRAIAESVGHKKSFRLRDEHLAIRATLEETIDSLLEVITPHVTKLDLYPYVRRYKGAKAQLTTNLRLLYDKDALEGEDELLRAFSVL